MDLRRLRDHPNLEMAHIRKWRDSFQPWRLMSLCYIIGIIALLFGIYFAVKSIQLEASRTTEVGQRSAPAATEQQGNTSGKIITDSAR